jgi:hypothetical protein
VRINLGFKAWSTLSAMLLSLAVISGCNDEGTTTTTPPANPAPAAKPAPAGPKMEPSTPPPSTPKADEKK